MNCRICGIGDLDSVGTIPGYVAGMYFLIRECSWCHSQAAFPQEAPEKLYDEIYQNGKQLDGYRRYFGYAELVNNTRKPFRQLARSEDVYWGVESFMKGRVKAGLNIVEVGSGLGYLVAALRADGYNARGIDISALAVAQANKRYGNWFEVQDVSDLTARERMNADVVVALELIEHVEDPFSIIEDLLGGLKYSGQLILSTPNRSYFPPDTLWSTDLPPVHLHWISEAGMRRLAERTQCTVDFVDFTDFNSGSKWMARPRFAVPSEPRHRLDEDFRPIHPYRPKHGYREKLYASPVGVYAKVAKRRINPTLSSVPGVESKTRSECMVVRFYNRRRSD